MCFNTKKIISVFLSIAMLFSLLSIPAFAEEAEANAETVETVALEEPEIEEIASPEEAPEDAPAASDEVALLSGATYYISTVDELNNVREDLAGTYYLMNDIDLSSYGDWIPIGHSDVPFSGSFDGQGYEITGMTIGNEEYSYTGLFGYVTGSISNLGVSGTITTTNSNVGMLAGYVYEGTIINCFSTGTIEANQNVGGLIGQTHTNVWSGEDDKGLHAHVENCYSKVAVTGLKVGTSDYLGGLIGKDTEYQYYENYVTRTVIKRCYATGYVRTKNDNAVYGGVIGGLTGNRDLYATVLFCYYDKNTVKAIDTDKGFAATTEQMHTQSIFTGWDFENVWGIDAAINGGYPYLKFGTYTYKPVGSGTIADPYIISTQEDLIAITEGTIAGSDVYYELANDIILDAVFWTPIGGNRSGRTFAGYFDGAGHMISGLNITQDNFTYNGLFGYVTGTITNLGVDGTIAITNNNAGMLAGIVYEGTVTNCYSTGTIEANQNVGGLIGWTYTRVWSGEDDEGLHAHVENCYSKVAVTGLKVGTSDYLGGLIGKDTEYQYYEDYVTRTVIKRCYATGYVRTKNDNAVYGGVIGGLDGNRDLYATILFCYYDRNTVKAIDTDKGFAATTAQMKTESIFTGWDFENVWGINSAINNGYPYLKFGEYEYENEGSGSKYDPYMVYTQEDLIAITEGRIGKVGSYYELANDLVLDAVFWTPIGGNRSGRDFSGYFNGAGHTISGLNIIQDNFTYNGLFGCVTGTVTNLGVDGTISITKNNAGMLAGYVYEGTVTNCFTTGSIEANQKVGGLIGQTYTRVWSGEDDEGAHTHVENCYSKVTVSGLATGTSDYMGGLIGKDTEYQYYEDYTTRTVIKRCYATGEVNTKNSGAAAWGGFIGGLEGNREIYASILFCYYDQNTTKAVDTNKAFAATTAQMKTKSIFTGWDFENVWGISASKNGGYPYLKFGEYEYENDGSGSKYDPYMVYTQEDLIAITEGRIGKEGSYYELANDIVLDAVFWTPIGGNRSGRSFNGYFDGAGHTISGLNITQDNFTYSGLFGYVTGAVTNLAVDGYICVTTSNVGMLAGYVYEGTVTNCYSTGVIEANQNVGGLIGQTYTFVWSGEDEANAHTLVENCYSKVHITGIQAGTADYLGGLIGRDSVYHYYDDYTTVTAIKNCYATSEINAQNAGASNLGGIIGAVTNTRNNGKNAEITACYYDQATTGMSDTGKGIPLSTAEMKTQTTYTGWDFDTVWAISSTVNSGYPYLLALVPTDTVKVTAVSLNKTTLALTVGSVEALTAFVTPDNATNQKVSWTSSNTNIATVTDGIVCANAAGTAIITATTADGGYTANCTVTVSDAPVTTVSVTGVKLNKSATTLAVGKIESLIATVSPADATNKKVSWKSSNTNIATVTDGIVCANAAGTAIITATTEDGGYFARCTVTVTETTVDENAPTVTISDIKTMPGNQVQVTVDLKNNTGFANLAIEAGYDSDVMTLTNCVTNTNVGATFTKAQYYTANPYNMSWDSASNVTFNGTLATLTFQVADNAPDGVYPITLDYYKGINGTYVDGDNVNYDENFDAVGFVYVSGNVIVASYTPGDINGDDGVDNKDATYLLRYLAGWTLSDIVEEALNVDGSTAVDNKDATVLLRYLAGWDVTLH